MCSQTSLSRKRSYGLLAYTLFSDFCKVRLGPNFCQSTVCPGTLPFAPDVRYIRYLPTTVGRGRQDFATVDENLAG